MHSQNDKALRLRDLHIPGRPVILFNAWDAGSARTIAGCGAKAIGTSSWSLAAACGYEDGEKMPRALAIEIFGRIAKSTDLPVTVDIESGYGVSPTEVGETVRLAIEAGAAGFNLEDSFPVNGSLRGITDQVARIGAARSAIEASGIECFLNARTDVFFQSAPADHDDAAVTAALDRAKAYAEAGADGLFTPGAVNISLIEKLSAGAALPLNVMMVGESPSIGALCDAGVARLSFGPAPFAIAMKALEVEASEILTG